MRAHAGRRTTLSDRGMQAGSRKIGRAGYSQRPAWVRLKLGDLLDMPMGASALRQQQDPRRHALRRGDVVPLIAVLKGRIDSPPRDRTSATP
jgi:hypothetical protein